MEYLDQFEASASDEERYRLLVDAATEYSVCMLDATGIVTSWNAGAHRFTAYEASEIVGKHFSHFYVEEDRRAGLPARALEISAREGKFESEGWRIRKDGVRFRAHVLIDPIRDPSGNLIGFAKITRDLTERSLTDETLRRSDQQFRLLVQSVADYAIYMLDPEGQIVSWNLGAERLKGYNADEIIGKHFSRFYTEEDLAKGEPQRALETATREGRFEKEGWRVRKDGAHFWANVVIDAIRDESGAILGFAKVTRDITERRDAQRALELAREALFQSQKMDAIGQLTGGVAHDFNNLLMVTLGSLELARKRLPDDAKLKSLIDNAIQAAQRGASLTQRMLAFARRQELQPEPIDVPVLVRGMTDLLRRSLGPSVAVETRFPLDLKLVQANSNQLELALLNLAVNARDAMPEGGSLIIAARERGVSPGQNLRPGRYICISITDTGEGMDEATLARAAEPFFTTKGVGKGTGLGLAMVHGVAEQSDGRLVLKSRKGEGTTAELWLPVAKIDAEPFGQNKQPALAETARAIGPLLVLAVDDDRLVLTNTTAMLEDLGHTVLEAAGGTQALDILRRGGAVDLVITDQAMPDLTGVQLAETIQHEWPNLPVILATGYAELPPGPGAHLPRLAKPFGQAALSRAIADVVGKQQK